MTPRGPLSLPPGGAHWYVLGELGSPPADTFLPSYRAASEFLDELAAETGIPPAKTVLGGFSQGSVMAYALGLGAGRPSPAGVLAMSGFIPEVDGFALDLESHKGLPVAIAHGTHDPVIPVTFGHEARDRLTAAGLDVLYRESPVGHGVDPRGIDELQAWLRRTLPARAAA